jgi:outer membrane lipase/esterase
MTSRRQWHLSTLTALVGAVLLAACGGGGGGDGPSVSRVISFGDSLSDLGTYAPATSIARTGAAPFFGGRFTTNNHTGYTTASNTNIATIWVESVAARVGAPITQAAAGFATTEVLCPAAANPALATSCTAYGQGGSRVTDPNGIGKAQGALTVPLVTQMARHITRFGSYRADEVVFVWAGNNDVFTQLGAVSLAGLPPATAIANLQTAGTQLATLVKDQVLARGATRVAVINLPDYAILPAYLTAPAPTKQLVSDMTAAFNAALTAGLAGSNVLMIDVRTLFNTIATRPADFGFTNVTTAACDPAKIQLVTGGLITDGSSLFCNAATGQAFNTLRTGASTTTWAFADSVHPTPGGHKVVSDFVITRMKDAGWIPLNQ